MTQLTASRIGGGAPVWQDRPGHGTLVRGSRVQPWVLHLLKPFAAGLVTFLGLDLVWIGLIANQFYKRELAGLARMDGDNFAIRLGPALVLYPLIILGLQVFALPRAGGGALSASAAWGGLFGLIGYGIYDLTNYAVLTSYTLRLTVVDMCWGCLLSAATATVMAWVAD